MRRQVRPVQRAAGQQGPVRRLVRVRVPVRVRGFPAVRSQGLRKR